MEFIPWILMKLALMSLPAIAVLYLFLGITDSFIQLIFGAGVVIGILLAIQFWLLARIYFKESKVKT